MTQILGELGTNPSLHSFFVSLMMGEITLVTSLLWLAVAAIISVVGGAIGGVLLAGKDIGYQLSAMLGSLLGPAGVIPAVAVGLVLLKLV
jgi:phage-related minor tail protein